MLDSWVDEVHGSARGLYSLFLFHLPSLGSSDRSHNGNALKFAPDFNAYWCFSEGSLESWKLKTEGDSYIKKYFYCPPTYLLIGFPKCGSSSLFRWLSVSAGVRLYANGQKKEAHFFHQLPSIAHKTYSNYLYHFPPLTEEEYVNDRNNIAIGDHTPGYIWRIPYRCRRSPSHFGCAGLDFPSNISITSTVLNVKHLLPTSTKLLVILRDPVERSYSHYWHWSAPCRMEQPRRTPECFHNLVVEQIEEISTCEKYAGFKCACK